MLSNTWVSATWGRAIASPWKGYTQQQKTMLKDFHSLSVDWIDCLVDRDKNWNGSIVSISEHYEPISEHYAIAVPLPYDTEDPKTVDCEYWLLRVWHDDEYFDLDIDWQHCSREFVDWCDRVYKQWLDAGFAEAVPIPLLWNDAPGALVARQGLLPL